MNKQFFSGTSLAPIIHMSIIRQDPTTKEWVILAANRVQRPDNFKRTQPIVPPPMYDAACPFCPGNEQLTPPELLHIPAEEPGSWSVRVFPNKFAALNRGQTAERYEQGPVFREMEGAGFHEVIVDTPRHDHIPALMEPKEFEHVLMACQIRYVQLRQDSRVKNILIFKNHGSRAGTSLAHPHCQIVGTPIAPLLVRRKYEVAMSHFDDTGRCLYDDIVQEEQRLKDRVVLETEHFVVFHPFASRLPFETWIAPTYRQSSFGQVDAAGLIELSSILQRVLRVLHDRLDNPDFNLSIHSSPTEDETKDYFLWHVQILPRINTIAGFELGSGIFINTMLPEDCAKLFRASLQ